MSTATVSVAQQKAMPAADRIVLVLLLGFVAALQISIALADILLAATLLGWAGLKIRDRTLPSAPGCFAALGAYALLTLVASAFSVDPAESFIDSRQLLQPGQTTLYIDHGGQRYLLRVTRENKLILTK